jgi:hypothetical protein
MLTESNDIFTEYLKNLSLAEIKNLCMTNKQINRMCTPELFTDILYQKTGITEPYVYNLIMDLDNKIEKIMKDNYKNLPIWVDHAMFWKDRKYNLYYYLIDQIAQNLEYRVQFSIIYLDAAILLSPLGDITMISEQEMDELNNKKNIKISPELYKYLHRNTVKLKNFHDILHHVQDLLFM